MNEPREALADYAHGAWCDYMVWFLSNCQERPDGSVVIPAGYVAAITRLIRTPYSLLSEDQKNNDRAEADKILAIVQGKAPPPVEAERDPRPADQD